MSYWEDLMSKLKSMHLNKQELRIAMVVFDPIFTINENVDKINAAIADE